MKTPRKEGRSLLISKLLETAAPLAKTLEVPAEGPIKELHIELTHRCGMKCVMCHHWRFPTGEKPLRDGGGKHGLSLAEIVRVVEGSSLLSQVETVVLTGGEPWLRKDLVEVAAFLAGRFPKARIGILTSLWDGERIAAGLARLKEAGIDRVWLGSSMDGPEAVHDAVRGRPGAFRRAISAALRLRREFPGLDLGFNFTIIPSNCAELWSSYRLMTDMGFWFGAQLVVNHEGFDAPRFRWKQAQLRSIAEQVDLIIEDLALRDGVAERLVQGREAEVPDALGRVLYWRYLKEYLARPRRFFAPCPAGSRFAMLDCEGGLFFCPVNKHRTAGSVRERPFDELWDSAQARAERGFIASGRCHCWLLCIANPVISRAMSDGRPPGARRRPPRARG